MNFWERFYQLCEENGTKPNPVCKELGFSSSTATHWKHGQLPGLASLEKVADYFDVSVDYLSGKSDTKKEQITPNKLHASDDLKKLIGEITTLSDEEARKVLEYVELLKLKRDQESNDFLDKKELR